jgi:hypothetical protein
MALRAAASGSASVEVDAEAALGLRHRSWNSLSFRVSVAIGVAIDRMVGLSWDSGRDKGESNAV